MEWYFRHFQEIKLVRNLIREEQIRMLVPTSVWSLWLTQTMPTVRNWAPSCGCRLILQRELAVFGQTRNHIAPDVGSNAFFEIIQILWAFVSARLECQMGGACTLRTVLLVPSQKACSIKHSWSFIYDLNPCMNCTLIFLFFILNVYVTCFNFQWFDEQNSSTVAVILCFVCHHFLNSVPLKTIVTLCQCYVCIACQSLTGGVMVSTVLSSSVSVCMHAPVPVWECASMC